MLRVGLLWTGVAVVFDIMDSKIYEFILLKNCRGTSNGRNERRNL